ncbi:hypothetical protein [Nonomuraea fuscirosea]|uniref:hypothetical protein n=1 Tax=Nonomuraea fuscirosea TaxID=1291556 RepID=UPI00342C1341
MPKPTPGTEPAADPPAARPHVQQIGVASGHGRVYQAGRDLTVHETVLPGTALRPVTEVDAPPATVNVPGHQQVFVGRDDELTALAAALQPELAAALPLEALAERAMAWLAGHEGWLLVLDDVTRPSDVAPLPARTLTGLTWAVAQATPEPGPSVTE